MKKAFKKPKEERDNGGGAGGVSAGRDNNNDTNSITSTLSSSNVNAEPPLVQRSYSDLSAKSFIAKDDFYRSTRKRNTKNKKKMVTNITSPTNGANANNNNNSQDQQEDVLRKKYHVHTKEMGKGRFGVVRKCVNRQTGEKYAIKSLMKAKIGNDIYLLQREYDIMMKIAASANNASSSMSSYDNNNNTNAHNPPHNTHNAHSPPHHHPNIIELIDVYEDDRYLHFVMELCTGGELFDRIIDLKEKKEKENNKINRMNKNFKSNSLASCFDERDAALLIYQILDAIRYCHDVIGIVHRDLKVRLYVYCSITVHCST